MPKYIVTGGAGFIGCNAVHRFQKKGEVVVVDDLSRKGTQSNLDWLRSQGPITFIKADVRSADTMERVFAEHADADLVLHFAGQVAVTSSVVNPREDFEINALGTFNVLEGIRKSGTRPLLIYASTNKVYGGMEQLVIDERETRYAYRDYPHGIPESISLDFHSPYGCSKGAADQYVHDYSRIYGLPTVVLRQSCIYGCRQFGVEDQGWLAWFVIAAVLGRPITIYGTGKQVRDVLYVDDLLNAYEVVFAQRDKSAGQIYNVGGGADFTMSVWTEFGPMLEDLIGQRIPVAYGDSRPGDQPVYVSDIRKIKQELGWEPKVDVKEGMKRLFTWVSANKDLFTF